MKDYHNDLPRITPQAIEQAAAQLCVETPDDSEVLDRLIKTLRATRPTSKEVLFAICEFYGLDPQEMLKGRERRMHEIVFARQVYCYFVWKYTHLSMAQIAARIGLADHTTVRHGIRKIARVAATRPLLEDDLDLLRLKISERVLRRSHRGLP